MGFNKARSNFKVHSVGRISSSDIAQNTQKVQANSLPTSPIEMTSALLLFSAEKERFLTTQIVNLVTKTIPPEAEYQKRLALILKLQTIFSTEYPNDGIVVHIFGSTMTGLFTKLSDMDICLTTSRNLKHESGINIQNLAGCLKKYGMTKIHTVSKAKFPLCKFFDPEFGIICDMNINNIAALRNSLMIKTYMEIDPRTKPLMMAIIYWAKRRGLLDNVGGTKFHTYALYLMVIFFLQTRPSPVLPNLHKIYQEQKASEKEPVAQLQTENDQHSFYRDLPALMNFGSANTESVGQLLHQFFNHFDSAFDYNASVISIGNSGSSSKLEKGWHEEIPNSNRLLCIEDPFCESRNLASSVDSFTLACLKKEFCRALSILNNQCNLVDVCELHFIAHAISSKDNSRYPTQRTLNSNTHRQSKKNINFGAYSHHPSLLLNSYLSNDSTATISSENQNQTKLSSKQLINPTNFGIASAYPESPGVCSYPNSVASQDSFDSFASNALLSSPHLLSSESASDGSPEILTPCSGSGTSPNHRIYHTIDSGKFLGSEDEIYSSINSQIHGEAARQKSFTSILHSLGLHSKKNAFPLTNDLQLRSLDFMNETIRAPNVHRKDDLSYDVFNTKETSEYVFFRRRTASEDIFYLPHLNSQTSIINTIGNTRQKHRPRSNSCEIPFVT